MSGNIWDVPMMPQDEWRHQSPIVWFEVVKELRQGWGGNLKDGFTLAYGRPRRWDEGYGEVALLKAAELGAPVHQMFTAVVMRLRTEAVS